MAARPAARRATAATPAPTPTPTPTLDRLIQSTPDLVDRIFDYVVEILPELATRKVQIKIALRKEFGGQEEYVRRRELGPQELAAEVERQLHEHGRNAYTVARILDIAPATVYRKIKAHAKKSRNLP